MSRFSIKDLEQLSGIKAHTIRIWEQRYGIIEPQRTQTNIRYYDDHSLRRLLNVALLNKHGYKISKISKLQEEQISEEIVQLINDPSQYEDQIHALTIAMIDLNEAQFEQIITRSSNALGFETSLINIVFPFLLRIGILWQAGTVNPAQEHFMSNLIRQKLIVAIDHAQTNNKSTSGKPKFLLFLPEGELHELGLLLSDLILKNRNNRSIYLGQSLPLGDLQVVYKYHDPDYVLTIITSTPGPAKIQAYIDDLAKAIPNSKILVSGQQVVGQDLQLPENVEIFFKPTDLIQFLDKA